MRFCIFFLFCSFLPFDFGNQKDLFLEIDKKIYFIENQIKNILQNPEKTAKEKNDFVVLVMEKNRACKRISKIISQEFLSKYISQEDANFEKKIISSYKIINFCFKMRASVDLSFLEELRNEVKNFKKLMRDNYKKNPNYKNFRKYNKKF